MRGKCCACEMGELVGWGLEGEERDGGKGERGERKEKEKGKEKGM